MTGVTFCTSTTEDYFFFWQKLAGMEIFVHRLCLEAYTHLGTFKMILIHCENYLSAGRVHLSMIGGLVHLYLCGKLTPSPSL